MTPVHPAKAGTHQWKKLRGDFKAYCRSRNMLCHLCVLRGDIENAAIDYDAPARYPKSFEPDHLYSPKTHPWLAYEWNNLAPSHCKCNRQRRDEPVRAQQDWVKPDW